MGLSKSVNIANIINAYKETEDIDSLTWPALSPDLNPLENMWDALQRRINARNPPVSNLRELERALHEECENITQDQIRHTVGSMKMRCRQVIDNMHGRSYILLILTCP